MPSSLQHVIRFKKQKQNKNVSKKDVFNILLLGFPKKKFPKEFVKTVCLKSNEFLNSICIMSVEHKTLIIILVAVDMYKNTNYAEYGKYYNDIWDWIDDCNLKITTPKQFMQFALQWSWL